MAILKGITARPSVLKSHIQYSLPAAESPQQAIRRKIEAANDLGLRIVIPQQRDRWRL